jgi:Tol biopolymer transport system component
VEWFKIPRVKARLAGTVALACALFALTAGTAFADAPPGPRLALTAFGADRLELLSIDPSGSQEQRIAGGGRSVRPLPIPFGRPSWSADGSLIAFSAFERKLKDRQVAIYIANADGSSPRKIPGTREGFIPTLSPDGRTLAFAKERQREGRRPGRGEVTVFHSASIWVVDLVTGASRQITPWRNRLLQLPSSFSPDGSTLAVSRRVGETRLAVALRLDGSGSAVIARRAVDPVYSPDGTRVALITTGRTRSFPGGGGTWFPTEIAVANADGSGLTRLTKTPRGLEVEPSWDPSGQRLAYTQFRASNSEESFLGFGDSIMQINADGSCRSKVLSDPDLSLYGAVWQPGPGREAGRIAC